MSHSEIEDGMGFSGLVPTKAERLAEQAELRTLQRIHKLEAAKDGAYEERNQCVALIARMAIAAGWRAGVAKTAIEGWSADWHSCCYVDLPTGQVSWHYHDSHAWMFADLPAYDGVWDGHTTPEKYTRVNTAL